MSIMKSVKVPLILGCLMFLNYCLNTISFRMTATGSYLGVGVTDAIIAWYGFTVIKKIGEAGSLREQIGYTLGGCMGSMAGLWLTIHMGH